MTPVDLPTAMQDGGEKSLFAPSAGTPEKISRYSEQGLHHPKTLYGDGYVPEIEPGQNAYSVSFVQSSHIVPSHPCGYILHGDPVLLA